MAILRTSQKLNAERKKSLWNQHYRAWCLFEDRYSNIINTTYTTFKNLYGKNFEQFQNLSNSEILKRYEENSLAYLLILGNDVPYIRCKTKIGSVEIITEA
jgi:hypothetical protein